MTMPSRRKAVLLLALCGVLYLPGAAVQFSTRGEAREALAVREVVESGRWLVPMRPDGQLTKKPPLFYWSGMLTSWLLPSSPEAAVRLPSVVAGTVGVLAVACLGYGAVGAAAGSAALMLATSFEWMRSATSARVDMLLAAAMTLVLLGWIARLSRGRAGWTSALVGLGTALAVLAKGPIGAGFPAAALVVAALIERDRSLLRLLVPLLAGATIAALWYVVAWSAHGRAFLDIVLAENLGRFVDTARARTGHAHGPLFLAGAGILGLLPWTPLLPLVASPGTASSRVRTLLLAWTVVIVAVVAVSASKRSVYLLPIFPAVALLMGDGLTAVPSPRVARALRVTTALYAPVLALFAFVLLAVAAGFDVAAPFASALASEDLASVRACAEWIRDAQALPVAIALLTLALAVTVARRRAAGRWPGLVPPVAGAVALLMLTFQVGIRPAIARARGFADFLRPLGALLPPGEPFYAYFPVDQSVRFYAPRPLANWRTRPGDRDVFLLAWEREVASLPAAKRAGLERLATSEAQRGSRGALVLLRVPRGVLPPHAS
jgi:4-amino-4-deoxy-L-arabinose transferase-like glycosyltransferase